MSNMNKELIKEDLEFMSEYIKTLIDRHPELKDDSDDIIRKMENRIKDISRRIEA